MTFEKEWEHAKKVVMVASEKVIRGAALDIFSSIIKASPVDTGRFRGNWQTTLSSPAQGELDTTDKNGQATLSKSEAVIAKYNLRAKSVFLTNNLPYADRLANGWSQQAPSGWIDSIISKFQSAVEKAAKENEPK